MSKYEALVQEFRNISELVVSDQLAKNSSGKGSRQRSRPGMNEYATLCDIRYASVPPTSSRPSTLGNSREHLWSIEPLTVSVSIDKHLGHVALISYESIPDRLVRRLTFASALPPFTVDSTKALTHDQTEAAVAWARSPHIHDALLRHLAVPTEPEIIDITERLDAYAATRQILNSDLQAMAAARRHAYINDARIG